MVRPRMEALRLGIGGELRLRGPHVAAVDTGLDSVREEMAAHPKAVDRDFMLDRIFDASIFLGIEIEKNRSWRKACPNV